MWSNRLRLDSNRLSTIVIVVAVALGAAPSIADAQTDSRGPRADENLIAPTPLDKAVSPGGSRSERTNAGDLLWEDRHDAGTFEQAFSVATLGDLTFAAGFVANGSVRDFVVRAYHASTGALAWQDRVDWGRDEFASGVVTAPGRVFVSGNASRAGTGSDWLLRAYEADTGRLLWEQIFDYAGRSDISRGTALAAAGDLVILGGVGTNAQVVNGLNTDYIVRAHDAASGALVWQDRIEGFSSAYSMAQDGDRLFVGGASHRPQFDRAIVRAYDVRSGTLLWEQSTEGAPGLRQTWTKAIRARDGRVFVAQPHRNTSAPFKLTPLVQAYDGITGARLWTAQFDTGAENEWLNEIDVFGGRVFAVGYGGAGCSGTLSNCDAIVRGYDATAGTLLWERQLDLSGTDDAAELVTAAGGAVFVLSQAEATYGIPNCCTAGRWVVQAFDLAHGRLLWQRLEGDLESGVYNMVVDRGRLFVPGRAIDRTTRAFDFIVRAYDVGGRPFGIETPFAAPRNLRLNGTSGSLSFDVTFDGTLTALGHGLIAADEQAGHVADDPANNLSTALRNRVGASIHFVSVPAGTRHLRVALFDEDTDGADDLDLLVIDPQGRIVGSSGSRTAAELVDVLVPAAGTYVVVVHGYETDGPDANYTLFTWTLGEPLQGNLAVSGPDPSTGPSGTVAVTWFGLTPGRRYLGAISYRAGGAEIGQTLVTAGDR